MLDSDFAIGADSPYWARETQAPFAPARVFGPKIIYRSAPCSSRLGEIQQHDLLPQMQQRPDKRYRATSRARRKSSKTLATQFS